MKIIVASGVGEGPTATAAFDAALLAAGAANYNLIPLLSVIPGGAVVVRGTLDQDPSTHGDRLYVVLARRDEQEPGREAWAGIGWVQDPADGTGLMVELSGGDREAVREAIEMSLDSMNAPRSNRCGPIDHEITGARCRGVPIMCSGHSNLP